MCELPEKSPKRLELVVRRFAEVGWMSAKLDGLGEQPLIRFRYSLAH